MSDICATGRGRVLVELQIDELVIVDPEEADAVTRPSNDEAVLVYRLGLKDARVVNYIREATRRVQRTASAGSVFYADSFTRISRTFRCGDTIVIDITAIESDLAERGDDLELGRIQNEFVLLASQVPFAVNSDLIVLEGESPNGRYNYQVRYSVTFRQR
jgi:hypothetical protein